MVDSRHKDAMTRRSLSGFLGVLVTLWLAVPALAVEGHGSGTNTEIVAKVEALMAEPALKGGFQGVVIQSLRDGSVWYQRNPDLMFLPASNQKLLTSAAVLNALGPDWRYRTTLLRAGEVDSEGTLHGDLYLRGSGDALLEAKDLDELAAAAKSAGIRRVAGRIVGDDSRFDGQRYGDGWAWDDMPYYYSAQISALCLNENLVVLQVDPGRRAGEPVRVKVQPAPRYVRMVNRAKTGAKGSASVLTVDRELGKNVITVGGSLALDAKPQDHRPIPVTVEDPALYAATVMADRLESAGVRVDHGAATGVTPSDVTEIGAHLSPPMSEILPRLNKPSDNLVAECLLKTLGAEKGKGGSAAAGREVALAWFTSIGMDPNGIDMTDGSGLSRQTYVTPRNLATLLRTMYAHPNGKVWIDSLPVAGVDGTLRNRMKGTPAEKNCRAKSGYVSSVSSLSGYVNTADGELLLFVMLMNNHRARNSVAMGVQDRIVELLASWRRSVR